MIKLNFFMTLLVCGYASLVIAQSENQKELSDIFSKFEAYDGQYSQPAKVSSSGFSFTKTYSTSYGAEANRPWSNTNVESDMFLARFSYTHSNPNLSYQASISTGGGIYSYRNRNGECIPKQKGAASNINADGTYRNQWTESAWHLVCNNIEYQANGQSPQKDKVIWHQGGAYGNISQTGFKPYYGFQLADHYDSALEEYSTVAWLQIGHPKATVTSKFFTEVLVWTKYRNIGNGILQIDQALYNFGDHTTAPFGNDFRTPEIDRINTPYTTNNDETHNRLYMSTSNGSYTEKTGQSWQSSTSNSNTDGWVAFIAGNNQPNSGVGYGFIFNNDAGSNKFGYVGASKAQNNFTAIRTDTDIFQGDLMNFRYFVALGNNVNAIQTANNNYQNHTRHELRNMPKGQADEASYYFEKSGNTITASNVSGASQGLELKLQPYENSFPIFIVTNTSGVSQVTTDLYAATRAANPNQLYPFNGITEDIKLLGFSDARATVNNFVEATINSGDSYTFPDGTTMNNITADMHQISFTGTSNGYRTYTQTSLEVTGGNNGGGNNGGGDDGNLALSGTASQSTTLNGAGAGLATDGNTAGNFGGGSVTASQGPDAWWQVDLGSEENIGEIKIFNRTDVCCVDRLADFTVFVLDNSGATTFMQTVTAAPNPSLTIDANGAVGKIIKIESNLDSTLNLAEVEVYASNTLSVDTISDLEGTFSSYPNPVKDQLTIQLDTVKPASYSLITLTGKTVIDGPLKEGSARIDVSDLASGLYLIRVYSGSSIRTGKMIKL